MRTITLHFDSEHYTNVEEKTYARERGNVLKDALGYLCTWGMSYNQVDIYPDGDLDFVARYSRSSDPSAGYTIGAVWHGDHYGFHS